MTINHEINIDNAVNKLKETLGRQTTDDKPKDDNIDYREFRCRIKTNSGTDINIPSGFVGFVMGVVCGTIIISSAIKYFKRK